MYLLGVLTCRGSRIIWLIILIAYYMEIIKYRRWRGAVRRSWCLTFHFSLFINIFGIFNPNRCAIFSLTFNGLRAIEIRSSIFLMVLLGYLYRKKQSNEVIVLYLLRFSCEINYHFNRWLATLTCYDSQIWFASFFSYLILY